MIQRDWRLRAATVVGWLGVLAFAACLLARMVAPYPRWDLLACLLVVATACGYWLVRVRGAAAGGGGDDRVRYWWPRRRVIGVCIAVPVLFVTCLLAGTSAESATEQLLRIRAGDPTIAPVEIAEVHDVRRYEDQSKVRFRSHVSVTAAEGDTERDEQRRMQGEVELRQPAETGDLVWGLYSPDAPQRGAILGPEQDLKALIQGGPSTLGYVALVIIGLSVLGYAAVGLFTRNSQPLAASFQDTRDRVRRARVRVAAVTAGRHLRRNSKVKGGWDRSSPRPALRLTSGEETRDFFVDRCLEPQALGAELTGRTARLYWQTPAPDEAAAPDDPAHVNSAVLVLDDRPEDLRYVYGEVSGGLHGPGLPSEAAPESPYEAVQPVHAFGPYAIWHPGSFRPVTAGLAVALLAAALLATGAGTETGYGGSGLLWVVGPLFGAPVLGLMLTARRVTVRLRELQRSTGGLEAQDPQAQPETAS
ncbi:hypothetical protein DB35_15850 [Streptomyces abyssalis]|uniref:DUF3592 domain-containing protein n=1 Tax=Streptomyces abyssalis TaxID=933944 RepID=A0A1E7JFR1_9ACTN|nr:hypothetical protein [Streptomyces abyssalis]OEU85304.1 hypothetical protein AN215_22170 [Streptomyces abyssalis]OEU91528.1 hypothetical protein DB35_15850 [Streptomyces abyssalis]